LGGFRAGSCDIDVIAIAIPVRREVEIAPFGKGGVVVIRLAVDCVAQIFWLPPRPIRLPREVGDVGATPVCGDEIEPLLVSREIRIVRVKIGAADDVTPTGPALFAPIIGLYRLPIPVLDPDVECAPVAREARAIFISIRQRDSAFAEGLGLTCRRRWRL